MTILTTQQFAWLKWLRDSEPAHMDGQFIVGASGLKTTGAACVSFLHLVAKGAVEVKDNHFLVSEFGRRLLTP